MKKQILIIFFTFLFINKSYSQITDNIFRNITKKYRIEYDKKRNFYSHKNTIYIFLDSQGNLIKSGIPTTASQKNTYKIIVIINKNDSTSFKLKSKGDYNPILEIENKEDVRFEEDDLRENIYKAIPFATIGPFTDKFEIEVTKKTNNTKEVILKREISVAKTYNVSLTSGLFLTTLSNPTNIKTTLKPNGDTTLIADDDGNRGVLTLNAVFYPKGRNFLFEPENLKDRLGYLIGTRIDKDQFKNFFGGIQVEFARGGSIAGGIHYGRVNTIHNLEDFEFGEDVFEGDLNSVIKKKWDIGFFIGVNIDVRVFGKIFNLTQ